MKYIYSIFFLLLTTIIFGQGNNDDNKRITNNQSIDKQIVILKIDSNYFQLDSLSKNQINPKWLKKIEVIKSERYANIYGNSKNQTILLYPKRRFKRRILLLL